LVLKRCCACTTLIPSDDDADDDDDDDIAIGVGERGAAGGTCPPKIREKYFSCNYYVKFGHFSGKNHVKFGNFVNFSGKYDKN